MNIIRYYIPSFITNEYYSIIRFTSKRLFVATLRDCVTFLQDACAWHGCIIGRDTELRQGNTEIELTAHVIHDCMT